MEHTNELRAINLTRKHLTIVDSVATIYDTITSVVPHILLPGISTVLHLAPTEQSFAPDVKGDEVFIYLASVNIVL
jgi:hypothetical protein